MIRGQQQRFPRLVVDNPARGIANAVLIGAAMWGIGFTIWWALVSGACGK